MPRDIEVYRSMEPHASAFGDLLRRWRRIRRLSQLSLATEAAISARHVCFLETGRARPSREMVRLLALVLDLPHYEQNALLLAAGYAPLHEDPNFAHIDLTDVHAAFDLILQRHEPYPAIVADGEWNIVMRNAAATRVFHPFRERYELPSELATNAMHAVCHPGGLRKFIANWQELVAPLIQTIHREASRAANVPARRLLDELLAYPGVPSSWSMAQAVSSPSPLLTMRLRKEREELAFRCALTTFVAPHSPALQQFKIECFYPADAGTARALQSTDLTG